MTAFFSRIRPALIFKIFVVGLLLQFFLHTFVTFGLGIPDQGFMQGVWLWKEGIIAIAAIGIITIYVREHGLKQGWNHAWDLPKMIRWIQALTLIACGGAILISLLIHQQSLHEIALAVKYDFMGFFIILISFHRARRMSPHTQENLVQWYMKVIQWVIIGSLLWYILIIFAPHLMELLGYDAIQQEGSVGEAPPLYYRTHMNQGLIRNKFIFERPIILGFFLTAIWPLRYNEKLKRTAWKKTGGWWILFMFTVLSTTARSAWGSILLISIPLILIVYRKSLRRILVRVFLPILVLIIAILYIGQDKIIHRQASNAGHVLMIIKSVETIQEHPLRGLGAARAGPGSHQLARTQEDVKGFNPENQFLQIVIEFGIIGALPWISVYALTIFIAFPSLRRLWQAKKNKKKKYRYDRRMYAAALGMVGLAISGMVLHSRSDRMVVYPISALLGLIRAQYYNHTSRQDNLTHPIRKPGKKQKI